MRVDHGVTITAQRNVDLPTVAELFDGIRRAAASPGDAAMRLQQVRDVYERAKAFGINGPYRVELARVALDALRQIGGHQAATAAFVRRLKEAIRDQNAAATTPTFNLAVPFELGGAYSTARAVIAANAAALAYAPTAAGHHALSQQGFSDVVTHKVPNTSAQALTAVRPDVALISFTGTADLVDFVKDARACLRSRPEYATQGKVHDGFTAQLDSLWPSMRLQIIAARQADPNRPVLFCGHSLGGALAVLAAARAKKEGLLDHPPAAPGSTPALLHTFGQPKVGDEAAAASLSRQLAGIPYVREVFRGDPVTQVPPGGMGYAHADATVVFHDGTGKTTVDGAGHIPALPQQLDPASAIQLVTQLMARVPDHNEMNYAVVTQRNWKP
ncbi:MAG: hypothetical protein AB2A00_29075 [Myxococcota bacterium]